jgi:hypothetical protein
MVVKAEIFAWQKSGSLCVALKPAEMLIDTSS